MEGIIARLMKEKNYGFIRSENKDFFFHASSLKNARFQDLRVNQEVTFEDVETEKGFRAEDVFIVSS